MTDKKIVRAGAELLDVYIDALTWDGALTRIVTWAKKRESRYVCLCNVYSLIEASRDPGFHRVLNQADMATPDGMPLAWMLRNQGFSSQLRIDGSALMWRYCQLAQELGEAIFLFGSTENTLNQLALRLSEAFPALKIGGMHSPQYPPSVADDDAIVATMNQSGAGVVFVGLGCPKQEKWMAEHRGRVQAVMIGVGAAFDFHAKTVRRAPVWMQRTGLEWLFRLCLEPRRLWKRYLITNAIFTAKIVMHLRKAKRRAAKR